jgi:hypothetical protein
LVLSLVSSALSFGASVFFAAISLLTLSSTALEAVLLLVVLLVLLALELPSKLDEKYCESIMSTIHSIRR